MCKYTRKGQEYHKTRHLAVLMVFSGIDKWMELYYLSIFSVEVHTELRGQEDVLKIYRTASKCRYILMQVAHCTIILTSQKVG